METTEPQTRYWRKVLTAGGILAVLGILLLLTVMSGRQRRAVIEAMEPQERQAVYAETYASFSKLCVARRSTRLADYCEQQGQLLLLFPECGDTCRQQVDSVRPGRTR